MIKHKLLLAYYVYIIEPIVCVFGSHEQFWQHYDKIKMLKKMEKLSSLEKELI